MGLSWFPPASRCKRFNVDNASLKSERFLNGSVVLPVTVDKSDLVLQDRPIYDVFISIMFDHPLRENMISQETIMDPCEFSFDASLFQIMGQIILFIFWSFPISVAMKSSLLDDVFWN